MPFPLSNHDFIHDILLSGGSEGFSYKFTDVFLSYRQCQLEELTRCFLCNLEFCHLMIIEFISKEKDDESTNLRSSSRVLPPVQFFKQNYY